MIHYNIKVTGLVQGVFFRDSTRQIARQLGLKGFVRNERDGSVYVEVEGERSKVDEFTAWLRKGPERASVEDLDIKKGALRNFESFEISF